MGRLEQMIKDGWFDPPKEYRFKIKLLTEKDRLALTLNGAVRIASTVDNTVFDLTYESLTETVKINTLPVHTKQTAAMANYTENQLLKYLQVESVYQETLLEEVVPPPPVPWYEKIYRAWKNKE